MAKGMEGMRAEVGCEGEVSRKHVVQNEEDLHCGAGGKLLKQVGSRRGKILQMVFRGPGSEPQLLRSLSAFLEEN